MPFLIRLRVYAKYHLPGFMVRFLQVFWRTFVHPTAQGVRRLKAWLIKTVSLGRSGPLPPDDLNFLVSGSTDPVWFLKSGRLAEKSIRNILAKNGISLKSLRGILDFGCGAGRVLRHFRDLRKSRLYGVDYNPDLIAWCRKSLPFARFEVNPFLGPLPFSDGAFDLIYALSVFTHLDGDQQSAWLKELGRVLRPGGYLLVSAHGAFHIRDFPKEMRDRFERGEMIVSAPETAGTNQCASFHSPAYMRSCFAPGFELIDEIPEGALGNPRQDLYLYRKR
jgi:SAM-dependent methyltransferase